MCIEMVFFEPFFRFVFGGILPALQRFVPELRKLAKKSRYMCTMLLELFILPPYLLDKNLVYTRAVEVVAPSVTGKRDRWWSHNVP
jgi:hypothetical protein